MDKFISIIMKIILKVLCGAMLWTSGLLFCLTSTSCVHLHHDKFGREFNEVRMKLGLPIIQRGWRRDASMFYPAPTHYTLWFTDSRPKDITLPYHAYKAIYYTGDTLIAERDTYLNANFKWFNTAEQSDSLQDSLRRTFACYHALEIIYVYKSLNCGGQDFSKYPLGFNYSIFGVKDGFADEQTLSKRQAEGILRGWNLKRLNY